MPNFDYVALNANGIEARGALQVADLKEACQRLKEMGLFPTKVVAHNPKPQSLRRPATTGGRMRRLAAFSQLPLPGMRARLPTKLLTTFTRQVATLLEAGMPLVRGLRLLAQQERNAAFKAVLAGVVESIEGGSSFSEALAQHPRVFNRFYVNMVRAGEVGGSLDLALKRQAAFMEKAQRIKGKVVAALYYPAAVLTVAFAITAGLLVFVVPRFRDVFADLLGNAQMPAFTRFVLGISDIVRNNFLWTAGFLVGLAVVLRILIGTRAGREVFDRLKLKLPLVGPLFTKAAIAQFTRTLGTLLSSGVPILQALTIVKETSNNRILQHTAEKIHESVKEGETLTAPLAKSDVFPAVVVGMVDVGEQTGALPDMLEKIADNYEEEVDNAVAGMTSLLEPILIVVLALLVGSIVIAMFLPIIRVITDLSNDPNGGAQ